MGCNYEYMTITLHPAFVPLIFSKESCIVSKVDNISLILPLDFLDEGFTSKETPSNPMDQSQNKTMNQRSIQNNITSPAN